MAETDIAGPSNVPSSENVTNDQEAEVLKKELQGLVLEVIGGNQEDNDGNEVDHGVGNINKAIQALAALKKCLEMKKRQLSSLYAHLDVYRCPISKEMMRDPVILWTGQTYDRPSIYKWLKDVHQMCPRARDVISHAALTPNHLVREQIQQWCNANNVQLLHPIEGHEEEVVLTISVEDSLNGFLQRLSTLSDQKQAAKEIRLLTKSNHSIRPYFSESADAIPQLLNPLSLLKNLYDHPDLQEDLVTIVLNISLHDGNKKIVCEYPLVIPLLVESLTCGTIDTRANAAAALSALSSLDSNKKLIGEKGDLKPLIHLLVEDDYHHLAMGDTEAVMVETEAEELKKELQRLVLEVIGGNQEDDDGNKADHGVGNINKAIQALAALEELNLERKKRQLSSLYDHSDVPVEYRCPISKEMMRDPVILSTGQAWQSIWVLLTCCYLQVSSPTVEIAAAAGARCPPRPLPRKGPSVVRVNMKNIPNAPHQKPLKRSNKVKQAKRARMPRNIPIIEMTPVPLTIWHLNPPDHWNWGWLTYNIAQAYISLHGPHPIPEDEWTPYNVWPTHLIWYWSVMDTLILVRDHLHDISQVLREVRLRLREE